MVNQSEITSKPDDIRSQVLLDVSNYLYYQAPDGNSNDISRFHTLFHPVYINLRKEFDALNIDTIVKKFEEVVSEFYAFTDEYSGTGDDYITLYMGVLDNVIFTLCDLYKVKLEEMTVWRYKYSPTSWGNMYWKFLHYASILVSYAYEHGLLRNTFLDFGAVIYNIDAILPCDICKYHYMSIKDTPTVRDIHLDINFGLVMLGTQYFHNVISDNINKKQKNMNITEKSMFYAADFAAVYECISTKDEKKKNSMEFVETAIDWQPITHRLLTVILATYCHTSYIKASNLLKDKLYPEIDAFDTGNKNIPYFDIKFKAFDNYSWNDLALKDMTADQVSHCLRKCFLLQFEETALKDEDIQKNEVFKAAFMKFFELYPKVIIDLVKDNEKQQKEIADRYHTLTHIILDLNPGEMKETKDLWMRPELKETTRTHG